MPRSIVYLKQTDKTIEIKKYSVTDLAMDLKPGRTQFKVLATFVRVWERRGWVKYKFLEMSRKKRTMQ